MAVRRSEFLIAVFILLGASLTGCETGEERKTTDLIRFLDATVINYHSQIFTLPEELPLNQELPPGSVPSYTARIAPVLATISRGGFDVVELKKVTMMLRMSLQPRNFSGNTKLKLYVGNQVDIYNDPTAVTVSEKKIMPDTVDLVSADSRLNLIFAQEEVVFGMEFVLEPTELQSHDISILGHMEKFEVEITGVQGIF